MSETQLTRTLEMCGLTVEEESLLPLWFKKTNEKVINNDNRNQVIITQLHNILFDDTGITITTPLLTTIRNRRWLAADPMPLFRTASQSLSVFVVGKLSENKLAFINEAKKVIKTKTTTTAKEVKESTKIKAVVPTDVHDFVDLLKNLRASYMLSLAANLRLSST